MLRNAAAPTLAVVGLAIPLILGRRRDHRAALRPPGHRAARAAVARSKGDVPVVLGTLLVTAVIVLVASLVINVLQTALNPLARRRGYGDEHAAQPVVASPAARVALVVLAGSRLPGRLRGRLWPRTTRSSSTRTGSWRGRARAHLLGTDYVGRDVLSRLMAGTRLSVVGAAEAVAVGAASWASRPAWPRPGWDLGSSG